VQHAAEAQLAGPNILRVASQERAKSPRRHRTWLGLVSLTQGTMSVAAGLRHRVNGTAVVASVPGMSQVLLDLAEIQASLQQMRGVASEDGDGCASDHGAGRAFWGAGG